MARRLIVAAIFAVLPLFQAAAQSAADEQAYCTALMRQYDRYYVRGSGGTGSTGTLDRALGEKQCREGKYAEGQKRLRDALYAIGFPPVERE